MALLGAQLNCVLVDVVLPAIESLTQSSGTREAPFVHPKALTVTLKSSTVDALPGVAKDSQEYPASPDRSRKNHFQSQTFSHLICKSSFTVLYNDSSLLLYNDLNRRGRRRGRRRGHVTVPSLSAVLGSKFCRRVEALEGAVQFASGSPGAGSSGPLDCKKGDVTSAQSFAATVASE